MPATLQSILPIREYPEETLINFEKTWESAEESVSQLSYYCTATDQWENILVPVETTLLRIGKDANKCDIVVNYPGIGDVQVVLIRAKQKWYILEAGMNDLLLINGLKKHQAILEINETTVINVGNFVMIATISFENQQGETKAIEGTPVSRQFSLASEGREFCYSFDQPCLVGANPGCDFIIKGNCQFAALISSFGKRMFIAPLVAHHTHTLERDGIPVKENTPLAPGSIITVDNSEIRFRLSRELRFTKGAKFAPAMKEDKLRLLEFDDDGNSGQSHTLPASGRSVYVGRSSKQSHLVLTGSVQISRMHAQVQVYDKSIYLIDNESTNGTFVNGKKIQKSYAYPGNVLRFGDLRFLLCYSE